MNRVLLAILFLFLPVSCVAEDLFDIKPVADGIYAAIAKPAYRVNCNAAIIILDYGVLVVDTLQAFGCACPHLIERIKKVGPGLSGSSSTHIFTGTTTRTTKPIPAPGPLASSYSHQYRAARHPAREARNRDHARPNRTAKADLQKASTPEQRDSIQKNISEAEAYLTELKSMQITVPTMTFDRSLILHRKPRTVEILWRGRAHTDGDVFAFLPKENACSWHKRFPTVLRGGRKHDFKDAARLVRRLIADELILSLSRRGNSVLGAT